MVGNEKPGWFAGLLTLSIGLWFKRNNPNCNTGYTNKYLKILNFIEDVFVNLQKICVKVNILIII